MILNATIFSRHEDEDIYRTDEDISTPIVTNIGLPDGEIGINNEIVQKLFEYFREDHNCMYNYVANISGTNSSKLVIAFNYLVDSKGVSDTCDKFSYLVIGNKYFCSDTLDINHDLYALGINSQAFLNYLKVNNTVYVDGGLLDQELQNIFGVGVGYIKEDFLYSNDSYIHYDTSNNKYVMYKYFNNNNVCKNYTEELVSATSNNGTLEIRSKLMEGSNIVRNLVRVFKFDPVTGKYIFQNRYAL